MRYLKSVLSATAPGMKDVLWLKPAGDTFEAYIMDGGKWKPVLSPSSQDDNASDEVKQELIGKSNDSKSKSTIYGAKAYAKEQAEALKGTSSDTASDLTLYGLKAYIDKKKK